MINNNSSSSTDDILDIGKQLRQEKLQKENQEKVERLKRSYSEEQKKKQQQKEEEEKSSEGKKNDNYKTVLFLTIIMLLAIGIRFYVASMPITDSWAEQVVEENLKQQVTNKIMTDYPTLSETKKQELVLQGTVEAINAQQNQEAIKSLSESYKESYKDPEGSPYLYEIDPYFFYDIANDNATVSISAYNLLAFVERGAFSFVNFFVPNVTFIDSIFYLPLVFTILCAVVLFFIIKELWNETAGFIAGLFFVAHPLLLEFSLSGLVDTNMLNMFFILSSGLLFLYTIKTFRTKKRNIKKYVSLVTLIIFIIIIINLFKYTWSAWYVSVGLIAVPFGIMILLFLKDFMLPWKIQDAKRKRAFIIGILILLVVCAGLFQYALGKEDGVAVTRIEQKILTPTLKKYLHLKYENPYGAWPEAFSLIKELQTTDLTTFVKYSGGTLAVLLSFPVFLYLFYKGIKDNNGAYLYFSIAYITFLLLSFRAIRILPYFIPFFAGGIGISMAVIIAWLLNKIDHFIAKEKKSLRLLSLVLLYSLLILPIAYPLAVALKEKSNIMPIMDDAIYDSAIFIRENANKNAIVSTWWDRGTFYKALAEREVHLHSQPHMPTTYWLASFYMTPDEVQAKNIILMLNNNQEYDLFDILNAYFPKQTAIVLLKKLLNIEGDKSTFKEKLSSINYTITPQSNVTVQNDIYGSIMSHLSKQSFAETYIVVIDDLMPRFSAVEYFAAWNFATMQPDPEYQYTDLEDGGCQRTQSGAYCSVGTGTFYMNFTNLEVKANVPVPEEVYLIGNGTVQHHMKENATVNHVLIVYNRAGYWKALYLPKVVADSMYVKLMILDGYDLKYFEKVFDEVHVETSWVKVYKVNWNAGEEENSMQNY